VAGEGGKTLDADVGATGRIRVVCPVYLDVGPFLVLRQRILESITAEPSLKSMDVSFLVLDDTAGNDPEIERLRELGDVAVLEPPYNLGHQRGLVYALRSLAPTLDDQDVIVTLDSDGEDRAEDVPRLVREVLDTDASAARVVVAKRTKRAHTPLAFRLMYPCFRLFFLAATGTAVESGNFAAYRARTAKRMLLHPSFLLCYSSALLTMDLPITFVPCERGARYSGSSRMGYSQLFTHAMRMLMPFSEAIARRTLWVFITTLTLAILTAILVVVIKFTTNDAIPGWATYALAGMSILSLVSFGNLVILFTLYSQSTAISLGNLEAEWDPLRAEPREH
jgi:hypothetical protein